MKSIEQLLELSKNPHYTFFPEEQERLDAFLSKKSGRKSQRKNNSSKSESKTPATVHAKNVVHKEDNVVPTDEQVKTSQGLAKQTPYHTTE